MPKQRKGFRERTVRRWFCDQDSKIGKPAQAHQYMKKMNARQRVIEHIEVISYRVMARRNLSGIFHRLARDETESQADRTGDAPLSRAEIIPTIERYRTDNEQ